MKDSPGLDVRDCPFDAVSDLVDGCVEFLLPVEEFPVWGFPDGREHAVPDIAFVTDPVGRVESVQDARNLKRRRVVPASVDRVGDPCQRAVQVANVWVPTTSSGFLACWFAGGGVWVPRMSSGLCDLRIRVLVDHAT